MNCLSRKERLNEAAALLARLGSCQVEHLLVCNYCATYYLLLTFHLKITAFAVTAGSLQQLAN